MSAPLAVDWSQAQALYCKGVPISEISSKTGIPLTAIRKHASRHRWTATKTEAGQAVLAGVTTSLAESATRWIGKIDTFVHKALDKLDLDQLDGLEAIETAVSIAERANRMARANYGLDVQADQGRANVQVNIGVARHSGMADASAFGDVIEVHAEPVNTGQDEGARDSKQAKQLE